MEEHAADAVSVSANVIVSVRPHLAKAVFCTILVVLFAIAMVWGIAQGNLYLVVVIAPVLFFAKLASNARATSEVRRTQVEVSSDGPSLSVTMRRAKLMPDGSYADQRYLASARDVAEASVGPDGHVLVRAAHVTCEALSAEGGVLDSHERDEAALEFVVSKDAGQLLSALFARNGLGARAA